VATDRLHVGIGAALLGKTCRLHDNSYGKNRAVYDHSIRNHFPAVVFE
jgi:exopolysaccharide biosynthesis predicted pyruvyltransferase EpsI